MEVKVTIRSKELSNKVDYIRHPTNRTDFDSGAPLFEAKTPRPGNQL